MAEIEFSKKSLSWRLIIFAVVSPLIVALLQIAFWDNIVALFCFIIMSGIVGLVVLIVATLKVRQQTLSALLMLFIYCVFSWLLYTKSYDIRTAGRWIFESQKFKPQVLAQSDESGGMLKHVEWEGWGFASSDTTVYLVFDPSDTLLNAAKNQSSGKFPGVPCNVFRVRRLEEHWYTTVFYTGTNWNYCAT